MEKTCQEHNILIENNGVIRVPFLMKGKLVIPVEMSRGEIEEAFAVHAPEQRYLKLPHAQLIRQLVIDRQTMRATGDYLYQILPPVDPMELVEMDIDKLVGGPYSLSVEQILQYLSALVDCLQANQATVERARRIYSQTSEQPDDYLVSALDALKFGLDRPSVATMIDNELSIWQIPGRKFLDGWVNLTVDLFPGVASLIASSLPGKNIPGGVPLQMCVRAMPTRQLHITAGNAPEIPLISAFRLLMTKSVGVIKSPFDAILPGALFALAAVTAGPDHPLTQNLSVVYWQGGDESIENTLFMPNAFDRVVVWGSPEAVTSVQSRAGFTKIISLNPRYGISMIGQEAFSGDVEQVAFRAAMDVMIANQKACTASQLQYIEGSEAQVAEYAACLAKVLQKWDERVPSYISPLTRGQLKRMKRGKYAQAEWLINTIGGEFSSGVIIMPGEFDMLDHPMCRLVILRRVENLSGALRYLHQGVSMVGVYPEERRIALRDAILARGVSTVFPLGHCESMFPGAPQDGMMILNQLVDWKIG